MDTSWAASSTTTGSGSFDPTTATGSGLAEDQPAS
jgi:hypothetical protein